MRVSLPISAVILALAFIVAGYKTVFAGSEELRLTKLVVKEDLEAGDPYEVVLLFTMSSTVTIERVCFLWDDEGPYCWKKFYVYWGAGEIRTKARTNNPNIYTLTGYVDYNNGTESKISNSVSADINVR